MRRLIRGGRIIDPSQEIDRLAHLLIEDDRVAAILRPGEEPQEVEIIPAEGLWVTPGLIDIHVHLRQPGHEYKEDIASGTRAAAAGGFTTVACMPNTEPVNDTASVSEFIMETAAREGVVRVRVIAAATRGLAGAELTEFGDLASLGVVGVSDDGRPIRPARMMRRVLEYASNFGLRVIDHPEDLSLSEQGLINEGIVSTRLGLEGIPAAAEEVAVFRDLALAQLTRRPVHLAHISTAGSVELIRRAKAAGAAVTAETAPHYFSLTEEALTDYSTEAKMNPPLRTATDAAAIKEGLADGTIDCIATDHAPHSALEKEVEFDRAAFGVIGLETALPLSLALIREGVLTPSQLARCMSLAPAQALGLDGGRLTPGAPADLTLIDPEVAYTIDPETFQSKARNTPFAGWPVQGRAVMTIVGGKIVWPE